MLFGQKGRQCARTRTDTIRENGVHGGAMLRVFKDTRTGGAKGQYFRIYRTVIARMGKPDATAIPELDEPPHLPQKQLALFAGMLAGKEKRTHHRGRGSHCR